MGISSSRGTASSSSQPVAGATRESQNLAIERTQGTVSVLGKQLENSIIACIHGGPNIDVETVLLRDIQPYFRTKYDEDHNIINYWKVLPSEALNYIFTSGSVIYEMEDVFHKIDMSANCSREDKRLFKLMRRIYTSIVDHGRDSDMSNDARGWFALFENRMLECFIDNADVKSRNHLSDAVKNRINAHTGATQPNSSLNTIHEPCDQNLNQLN